jgi:hypothetical protein
MCVDALQYKCVEELYKIQVYMPVITHSAVVQNVSGNMVRGIYISGYYT